MSGEGSGDIGIELAAGNAREHVEASVAETSGVTATQALPAGLSSSAAGEMGRGWAGARRGVRSTFTQSLGLVIAGVVLFIAVMVAIFPGLFTNGNPTALNVLRELAGPSSSHWFGTDNLGRDEFSRVIYGTRLTLVGPLVALGVALPLGAGVGLAAGTVGGWLDSFLMRAVDTMMALPAFLLALAIIISLGFSTINAALAVGIALSTQFARLTRAEVLRVRANDYVEAARVCGVSSVRSAMRHILPNSLGPVLALATLNFGTALMVIASLSFLGFGAQPPSPELGLMISQAEDYLSDGWWLAVFPGVAIVLIVLSVNYIGRWLRARYGGVSL